MQNILGMFRARNIFQQVVTTNLISSYDVICQIFLRSIHQNPQQFINYINCNCQLSFNQLQKITLIHHILLHTSQFYELFESLNLDIKSSDAWMNENILKTYQNFIRRILHSSEYYEKIRVINYGWNSNCPYSEYECKMKMRKDPKEYFNFEIIFYCINMLNDLFGFLKHVPSLGRYYSKQHLQYLSCFVYIASYQSVLLYFSLKFVINQMVIHHQNYLSNHDELEMFKQILKLPLEKINEDLKILLLNKYFNPIQRGIKVTLFELDLLTMQTRQILQNLQILPPLVNNKTNKNRKYLKKSIFKDKKFNSNMFQQSIELIGSRTYIQQDLEQIQNKENISNNIKRPKRLKQAFILGQISIQQPNQAEQIKQ